MSKKKILSAAAETGLLALFLVFFLPSCTNQLLPEPSAGSLGGRSSNNFTAPQSLTASQGKKGIIELSWTPVDGAVRYLVYKSDHPIQGFSLCGETSGAGVGIRLKVPAGTAFYYRVEAVNGRNEKSPQSASVFGTSLAPPLISAIDEDADNQVRVYWYMINLDSYKSQIQYTVSCFNKDTNSLVQSIEVDGLVPDTYVEFTGLAANTSYTFQVEASHKDAPDEKETSGRLDAATARRLLPGKPVNLRTVQGGSAASVTLFFDLPETADIVVGDDQYEAHPLYFVISRRKAGTGGAFQVLCPYFGADTVKAAGITASAVFSSPYSPGTTVSWTDLSLLDGDRGVEYEYQVQSYTDGVDRVITSPNARAVVTGWVMKRPSVAAGTPVYAGSGDSYESAALPLEFVHDDKGVAYAYILRGNIEPIGDGNVNDAAGPVTWEEAPLNLAGMAAYVTSIDLTGKTTSSHRGRGFYSYSVEVRLGGDVIETVHTVGSKRVFETNLAYLSVENFSVKDGYPDKFVLVWKKKDGLRYKLSRAGAATGPWTEIADISPGGAADTYEYLVSGQSSGISRYFSIHAMEDDLEGDICYSPAAQTLGTPALALDPALSYDTITLNWAPVQKADYYRVSYKYQEAGTFTSIPPIAAASLSQSAGKYVYGLKPEGSVGIDAAKAGKPVTVKVEALNEARRLADGGAEIVTVSNTVDNARLFGPAGLEQPGAVTAAQNLSTSEIELSWNAVTGAAGYYIIRRQYALDNSDPVPAGLTLLYYVNAADMHLKGKDILLDGFGIKTDSDAVSAEIAYANGTYTLKDQAIPDVYYTEKKNLFGLYADEQNDMLWGYPYRYHVVPVLSENDKPIMDSSCSLGGVSYSAASMAALEKTGRALGFVFDVTATKGTYSSGGDSVNDGIGISWTRPDYLPAGTKYQVFRRREASSNDWDPITTSPITAAEYEDKYGDSGGPVDGTVYEYVVGVSLNGSNSRPDQNARFINQSRTVADEDFPAERKMSGFVLPRPTMISASRTVNLDPVSGKYYEIVKWNSVGVDSLSSDLKNRGVSGYEIQVRDQSGERAWQALQTVLLETDDDKNRLEFTANLFNDTGLLTVLRDYRHYFRVRAFVSHGGRVYSRAPENPSATLDGTENDYVKWGVKQISAQEFAALTSLTIGSALQAVGTLGSSSSASQTVTLNHTPFFQTAGGSLTVNVSISGTLARYVSNINSYAAASLNFTGNVTSEDGAPLYSGTVKISGLTSTGGTYEVTYNGSTVSVNTALARKPFTFGGNWSYVLFGNNNGQFQDCSGLYNWNETTGWQ